MSKAKVLLFYQDPSFAEFVSVHIEANFPLEVLCVNIPDKFHGYISDPSVKFCMTDHDIRTGGGRLFYLANKNGKKRPFFFLCTSEEDDTDKSLAFFFKDSKKHHAVFLHSLDEDLTSLFGKNYKEIVYAKENIEALKDKEISNLIRVRIHHILKLEKVNGDVYVKLPSGKYIKMFNSGDEVRKDTVQNMLEKGVKFLYQAREDYQEIADKVMENLKSKLSEKSLSTGEKIKLQLASVKQVQDTVKNMGINDSAIELTDEIVNSVQDVLKDSKNIWKLVSNLLKNKSYFFTRTSIQNYLLGGLVQEMGWDSHATLKKLVYASVFCDFGFTDNQKHLAEILVCESDEFRKLASIEKEIIKGHPRRAVELLKSKGGFLTDEISIIEQHHEKPDGSGFPRGIDFKHIPPMSAAFILTYDFTQTLMETSNVPDKNICIRVLDSLGSDYSKVNFEKPFHAFKTALKL